mmetsp:Transcript_96727/g.260076  ORF Transcript_96727/g.260076 Transcript_96727/m.260076 type:complete len:213 (-) Transcript_96727:252-890(-)
MVHVALLRLRLALWSDGRHRRKRLAGAGLVFARSRVFHAVQRLHHHQAGSTPLRAVGLPDQPELLRDAGDRGATRQGCGPCGAVRHLLHGVHRQRKHPGYRRDARHDRCAANAPAGGTAVFAQSSEVGPLRMSCSWYPWSTFHTISSAEHVVHDYVHSQLQLFVSCLANCVQTCTDRTASEACFHVYRENSPLILASFHTACAAQGMHEIER